MAMRYYDPELNIADQVIAEEDVMRAPSFLGAKLHKKVSMLLGVACLGLVFFLHQTNANTSLPGANFAYGDPPPPLAPSEIKKMIQGFVSGYWSGDSSQCSMVRLVMSVFFLFIFFYQFHFCV